MATIDIDAEGLLQRASELSREMTSLVRLKPTLQSACTRPAATEAPVSGGLAEALTRFSTNWGRELELLGQDLLDLAGALNSVGRAFVHVDGEISDGLTPR